MSKKVIENIKKYKLAEKYLEKAKRRDNSYKFLVTGIDIKQLQKEKENPSLYQGRSRAFNYRPYRNTERLEQIIIPSYTGDLVISFEYVASQGVAKYIDIIDIRKVDRPNRKQKEKENELLTERQIRNRAVRAAEMIMEGYPAESYYINNAPVSDLDMKKDLVNELTILYIQEYGVRNK